VGGSYFCKGAFGDLKLLVFRSKERLCALKVSKAVRPGFVVLTSIKTCRQRGCHHLGEDVGLLGTGTGG